MILALGLSEGVEDRRDYEESFGCYWMMIDPMRFKRKAKQQASLQPRISGIGLGIWALRPFEISIYFRRSSPLHLSPLSELSNIAIRQFSTSCSCSTLFITGKRLHSSSLQSSSSHHYFFFNHSYRFPLPFPFLPSYLQANLKIYRTPTQDETLLEAMARTWGRSLLAAGGWWDIRKTRVALPVLDNGAGINGAMYW